MRTITMIRVDGDGGAIIRHNLIPPASGEVHEGTHTASDAHDLRDPDGSIVVETNGTTDGGTTEGERSLSSEHSS